MSGKHRHENLPFSLTFCRLLLFLQPIQEPHKQIVADASPVSQFVERMQRDKNNYEKPRSHANLTKLPRSID